MTHHTKSARIVAVRSYLPERVLTNEDLEKMVDTSDEWIVSRTGMRERRIAAESESTSDLGAKAAQKLLKDLNLSPDAIDMIIVATMSPDYISPSTANLIQAKIEATHAAAMDVQAACSGFIYALSVAKAYVESSMYRNVLVIAAEKMSAFMDYTDRTTCVLFGDGAAAVLVRNEGPGLQIHHTTLGADGSMADLVIIPAGGAKHPASLETLQSGQHYFKMKGNEVFKYAVKKMAHSINECLAKMGQSLHHLTWVVPHQANKRIFDALAKQLEIDSSKLHQTLEKFGNTSASSIPIALEDLLNTHPISKDDLIMLVAFGGGLTWGASLLTHVEK